MTKFPVTEAPGLSVFYKDEDGAIDHTYSSYARGLDMGNAAYHWLDLMPRAATKKIYRTPGPGCAIARSIKLDKAESLPVRTVRSEF